MVAEAEAGEAGLADAAAGEVVEAMRFKPSPHS